MSGTYVLNQMPGVQKVVMIATDNSEEEINRMAAEQVEEEISDEVFSNYRFKEIIPGCLPHPGDVVESGSLAAIEPPPVTYPLSDSLPSDIYRTGKLSSLQLEGVVHACQRHQVMLRDGCRAGFFLGDAAGVGKGRQIAGMLLDNFARGRTKHIWFSISSDLIVDARRDLVDINCHIKVIEGCQQLDKETRAFGLSADLKEGVIFCTYASLISSVSKGGHFSSVRQSRLQQIVDWCGGPDFSGCLIFDECHKAKHFVPDNEQASTKVATAVCNLQKMLPKARVVYCSATGVSGVKNMAFMERLGLWGTGAPFKSFDVFLEAVQKKGLGLAEMLAMDMKSSGIYLSRSLSFKEAEFVTVEISLTAEQIKMYNLSATVWGHLFNSLGTACERTESTGRGIWATYWATHQRFFKQLCLGLKVDAIVRETKQALSRGQCVVIGLQTTGEASLQAELNKNGENMHCFVSLCREILSRFIELHFPTTPEAVVLNFKTKLVYAVKGAEPDEWCQNAKKMLLEYAQKMPLPNSSLDELIDRLGGVSSVAEMTGRKGRIVRPSPGQQPQYQARDAQDPGGLDSLNVRERNAFMSGQKFIAIISDAASTGISLHADNRVTNQRRRVHLTVELPWSADKAVQQLGRSHRSNQSSGPLYKLLTTELGGEKRFAAAVALRLQSLGALTRGDRRAASGADLAEFNFDTPYGRAALRQMYTGICQKAMIPGVDLAKIIVGSTSPAEFYETMLECLHSMDVVERVSLTTSLKVKDKESCDVGRFLNRILGLSVMRQKQIFTYFTECLKAHIASAKKEGRYNEGLVDVVASSIVMVGEPRLVFCHNSNQLNPTRHVTVLVDRGLSWERALERLAGHPGPDNGFYRSRRDVRGKHLLVLATLKEGSGHMFKIARPNTGVSNFDEAKSDLLHKYAKMSTEQAEIGWKEQYDESMQTCVHGPRCRQNKDCTVGTRCYKMHLLCGGMMNLMSILELTVTRHAAKFRLTKAECNLRVVRVQLDSGERVIGLRYPLCLIHLAEKALTNHEATVKEFLLSSAAQSQITRPTMPGVKCATSGTYFGGQSSNRTSSAATQSSPTASAEYNHYAGLKFDVTNVSTKSDDIAFEPVRPCVVEPVSPIVQKCLLRATAPAPTIKNFFESKRAQSQTNETKSKDVDNLEMPASSQEEIEKTERLRSEDTQATGDTPTMKCEIVVICSEKEKLGNKLVTKLTSNTKLGTKRSACNKTESDTKKHKPGSIMAMLQRKLPDAVASKASNVCPVCSAQFDSKMSNVDINKHIDDCVIE